MLKLKQALSMFADLEEDYPRYSNKKGNLPLYLYSMFGNHGFRAIALYRLGRWFLKKNRYHLARFMEHMIFCTCHCEISCDAEIAPGCRIIHPIGLVIGEGTYIGLYCDVHQNVTFGSNFNKRDEDGRTQPWLEDHVSVGAGTVIVDPVKIGSHSIIGANSVVTKDVPANVIVSGIPAIVIKERWSNSLSR